MLKLQTWFGSKIRRYDVRVISIYVPHAGYLWGDFTSIVEDLCRLTREAIDNGKKMIITGDFNLSLNQGARGDGADRQRAGGLRP